MEAAVGERVDVHWFETHTHKHTHERGERGRRRRDCAFAGGERAPQRLRYSGFTRPRPLLAAAAAAVQVCVCV